MMGTMAAFLYHGRELDSKRIRLFFYPKPNTADAKQSEKEVPHE